MLPLVPLSLFLLHAGALALPAPIFSAETAGPNRRGIPYNNPGFVSFFNTPGGQTGWTYNWDSRTGNTNAPYEFVPMLHSLRPEHVAKWAGDVDQAARFILSSPTRVLGFNEPDNCDPNGGGACMSVGDAVAGWKQYIQPLKGIKDQMFLGSPAVTNGAGDNNGLNWLKTFLDACTGCSIDFINVHWYDSATNAVYFKSHIKDARRVAQGRPIWVTEFKPSGSDDQIKAFLDDVIPWMDRSSDIHRYAYFMAAPGSGSLINDAGTGLSDIGVHYQSIPYQG